MEYMVISDGVIVKEYLEMISGKIWVRRVK